jgi:hypothetical protein
LRPSPGRPVGLEPLPREGHYFCVFNDLTLQEKNMRGLMLVGVILIVAGIAGLVVNVIPIHHQEQVAKIGPITATTDQETDYVIPPWASIIVILVGAGLAYAGTRRS